VEEYTCELDKLAMKYDLQEPEEQTIVTYLGGLDPKYANVVDLQAYTTFYKVCVLVTRLSNKRKQDSPLSLKIPNPLPETNLLTREVLIQFLSHQIHPLPFHKETKLHKRSKPVKTGPILTP